MTHSELIQKTICESIDTQNKAILFLIASEQERAGKRSEPVVVQKPILITEAPISGDVRLATHNGITLPGAPSYWEFFDKPAHPVSHGRLLIKWRKRKLKGMPTEDKVWMAGVSHNVKEEVRASAPLPHPREVDSQTMARGYANDLVNHQVHEFGWDYKHFHDNVFSYYQHDTGVMLFQFVEALRRRLIAYHDDASYNNWSRLLLLDAADLMTDVYQHTWDVTEGGRRMLAGIGYTKGTHFPELSQETKNKLFPPKPERKAKPERKVKSGDSEFRKVKEMFSPKGSEFQQTQESKQTEHMKTLINLNSIDGDAVRLKELGDDNVAPN